MYTNYTTNGFLPVVRKKILDNMLPEKNILASWVFFSQASCLLFKPTSSLCKSFLVKSLVYSLRLHPRFVSLFYSSFLSFLLSYKLTLEANETNTLTWYINVALAVHANMKFHTWAVFTMVKGSIISSFTKQKEDLWSSTES